MGQDMTPLLTNIRERADEGVSQGRDVYFAGEEGQEDPERDKAYKFSYYHKAPPKPPSDDELDFFEKRKAFMERAKEHMGYDPNEIDPAKDAYAAAEEALRQASPSVRLFGPQTPEDYRKLKTVFEGAQRASAEKRAQGFKLMNDLDSMFRKDYEEQRKHDRTLQETAARESARVAESHAAKLEERRYNEQMDDFKWKRSGEREKEQAERKQALLSKDIDYKALAKSIIGGQDAAIAVRNARGENTHAKVKSLVLEEYPKFSFMMSDANYKWKQSATNQRTINFAGGSLPRLRMLDEQLKAMPNVNLNTINKIMGTVLTEMGRPAYTDFESNRNAIVQEINTALSGSSQGSDMRVQLELENLKSKRAPRQIMGAISNLREALIARLDIDLAHIYPMDVVRGQRSMKQYKDALFRSYRGNAREENVYEKTAAVSIGSHDDITEEGDEGAPRGSREVVERRRTKSGKILVKYADGTIGQE